jgi:hypothetical protein
LVLTPSTEGLYEAICGSATQIFIDKWISRKGLGRLLLSLQSSYHYCWLFIIAGHLNPIRDWSMFLVLFILFFVALPARESLANMAPFLLLIMSHFVSRRGFRKIQHNGFYFALAR